MAHPQSTPRGAFARNRIEVGANQLTSNASGLKLNLGLALSGEGTDFITQDSTAVILPSNLRLKKLTAVPSGRQSPGTICMVGNSTGNMIACNTTGTTWKYLNVTSVLA